VKTIWLSFADESGHLGVAIVDVTAAEAAAEKPFLHPNAGPGAEWLAAALRITWHLGINPGGNVQATIIPSTEPLPRNVLLTKADLDREAFAAAVRQAGMRYAPSSDLVQ
jgi:hypothetical protein